jgi:hypothetical protein
MDPQAGTAEAALPAVPKRPFGWAAAAAAPATAALVAFASRLVPLIDVDLLWQARTGDLVLATGRRVETDAFSRFFRGQPFHDHEPAWEALVALADRTPWQLTTLWCANLVVATLVAAWAARLAARLIADPWARAFAAALVTLAVSHGLEARAELATVAAIALAHGARRGGVTTARRLAPVIASAVGVLFHGLAWLVCVVPLVWAADSLVRGLRGHPVARRIALRSAALDVAIAVGAALAAELVMSGTLRSTFDPLRRGVFVAHHGGAPWPIAEGQDALPLIAIGVSALAFAGLASLAREGRANFADAALLAVLTLPGLVWSHFTAVPLLATFPWAIAGVAALFARGLGRMATPIRASIALATVIVVLGIAGIDVALEGVGASVGGYDFRRHPKLAVEWTRAHLANATMFHASGQGAYLIYSRALPSGVVLDSRGALLYPPAFAARYDSVLAAPLRFEEWSREAGFNAVLLTHSNKLAKALARWFELTPGWKLVYADDHAAVYVAVVR